MSTYPNIVLKRQKKRMPIHDHQLNQILMPTIFNDVVLGTSMLLFSDYGKWKNYRIDELSEHIDQWIIKGTI